MPRPKILPRSKTMQGPNNNDERSLPSSDLVTGKNLLTREEECTLKTALAFVVIKARARARSNVGASENRDNESRKQQRTSKSHDSREGEHHYGIDPPLPSTRNSSVLDHLFCHHRNDERMFPNERRSLECTGDQDHVDYMFRAAKTLAETWVVMREKSPARAMKATTIRALQGATAHLAHQLQVLLVANGKGLVHKRNSSVNHSSLHKSSENRVGRYRCPSLSSRFAVSDSTVTRSSFSRTPGCAAAVVVAPASQSTNKDKDTIGDENNQNQGAVESIFLIQEWIRSTLLEADSSHQQCTIASDTVAAKASGTILSCQNTTVLDIQSSFHVYTVMIPQIARISPPLIGHIFQVVARLVKDLYSDKITLVGEDGGQQLLDHLATSALSLLELCWKAEITVGGNISRESHRSFLLLSLQEILGELLVPLSRLELTAEHYRLSLSSVHRRLHSPHQLPLERQRKRGLPYSSKPQSARSFKRQRFILPQQQSNQLGTTVHSQSLGSANSPHQLPLETQRKSGLPYFSKPQSVRSFKRVRFILPQQQSNQLGTTVHSQSLGSANSSFPQENYFASSRENVGNDENDATKQLPRTLDPEAKLLLRMAVYRLILMERKE